MDNGTPMEKIKAFQQIESFVSDEFAEQIAHHLGLDENDRGSRLNGKDIEYDFLFRCHSLGEVDKIIAFEEGLSRLTKTRTVDFLFFMKDGSKLAIEVKAKEDPHKPITSSTILKEQREFAELFGCDLYYAVFIGNDWRLHTADYVEANNRIIGTESYPDCKMHILGERYFVIGHPITVKAYYRKQTKKALYVYINELNNQKWGIQDSDFGFAEKIIIDMDEQNIVTINQQSAYKFLFMMMALHALFSRAAHNDREVINEKHGRTLVIDTSEDGCIINLSDFLIQPVYSLWRGRNQLGIPRKFIAHLVDKKDRDLMSPSLVLKALSYLREKGIDISIARYTDEGFKLFDFVDEYADYFEAEANSDTQH